MPLRPDKLTLLSYSTVVKSLLAEELYGKKGFVVIKSFLSEQEVNSFKLRYCDRTKYSRTLGHIGYQYQFKNNLKTLDENFYEDVRRASRLRNEIGFQHNSDLYLLDYCNRYNLDPEEMDILVDHQLNHSYFRVVNHLNGDLFPEHLDYPGEIQGIIFLTKKFVDYSAGGLMIKDDGGAWVDVDAIAQPGDLVLLNGYSKKHRVDSIECSSHDLGRITMFLPVIPEYAFPNYYWFKGSPMRLHFSIKPSLARFIKSYVAHIIRLVLQRTQPFYS
jgi:hypothetical protein